MTEIEKTEIINAVIDALNDNSTNYDDKVVEPYADDVVLILRKDGDARVGKCVTWEGLCDTITASAKNYAEASGQSATTAEEAKNAANNILEQVQSKGTEITNFVATSKTEIETQKNESVNAVKSVYQTDLDELKGDISDIRDIAVIDGTTANLYNPLLNLDSTITIAGGQVYTRTLDSMQGAAIIPIRQGFYYQLIDFDANGNASVTTNNWRIITNGGTLIRYADGQQPFAVNYQASHSAETTAILQINLRTSAVKTMIVEFYYSQNSLYTSTYVSPLNALNSCRDWNGKVWCTYGDSFVAQGNGDLLTNGWQKYVNDYMGFAKHFGRGIGGTSFLYGSKLYYLDGHGVYDTSYTSGTLVHGGFCAWDRITNQIPEKVRNDIDLLFVLGGNNDYTNYYNPDNTSWKEWSASNTDDADWISYCTSHGLPVGDYQIGGNPKGAIMSMVMKLQTWCPNAIIVICGGAPTRGDVSGQNMTKPSEKTVAELTHNMRDIRDMVKDVADWCSIPYVDIYSNMGVNFLNRNIYSDDTIHPNTNGQKMLARSICGALKNILPKDIFDN